MAAAYLERGLAEAERSCTEASEGRRRAASRELRCTIPTYGHAIAKWRPANTRRPRAIDQSRLSLQKDNPYR